MRCDIYNNIEIKIETIAINIVTKQINGSNRIFYSPHFSFKVKKLMTSVMVKNIKKVEDISIYLDKIYCVTLTTSVPGHARIFLLLEKYFIFIYL